MSRMSCVSCVTTAWDTDVGADALAKTASFSSLSSDLTLELLSDSRR
jgi:hypothetical protein